MNIRAILVGFLAVVSGLSAVFLVQGLRKPADEPVVERVPVVYAAADIKPGETLTGAMLEVRQVRKEEAPEDAVHEIAEAIDRAAQSQLDKGDMLRGKKLAEKGAGRGMAALIRPGMRAFTIQTPSFSSSLAGFILPGNRVDVLLTMAQSGAPSDDDAAMGSTTTLLQNAEILAVHTTVNTPTNNKIDPNDARSVTLLVTPEDASLLDLGQNKGTLHLSLRNIKDLGNTKPRPTTIADLNLPRSRPKVVEIDAPKAIAAPAAPPEPVVVKLETRTLRGTHLGFDQHSYIQPPPAGKAADPIRPAPPTDLNPADPPFAARP